MSSYTSHAVLDFETTGIGPTDRVIEIGVVLLDEHLQVKKTWDTLVYPERDIPNSFVHKITESDVAQAPTFAAVSAQLARLLGGRTMVAHGADFEHRFLRQEFGRLGVVWPSYGNWIIDTKDLSRQFLNTSSVHEALDIAGIFNVRPHSALSDAMATAKFLQWLMQQDFDITCNPQVL